MVERRTRRIVRTRLLGFGPWGWALLGVFVAILAWAWITPDPRYQVMVGLERLFGCDAVAWFVRNAVMGSFFAIQSYVFNPIHACVLAAGAVLSVRHAKALPVFAIASLGVLSSCLWFSSVQVFRFSLASVFPFTLIGDLFPKDGEMMGGALLNNLVIAVMLAVAFRSWVLPLAVLSPLAVAPLAPLMSPHPVLAIRTAPFETISWTLPVVVSHITLAALAALWAYRVRSALPAYDDGCPNCGYDTSNLPEPVCPECGCKLNPTPPPGATRAPALHDPEP